MKRIKRFGLYNVIIILMLVTPGFCTTTWSSGDYEIGSDVSYDRIFILNDVTLTLFNGGTINELYSQDDTLVNVFGGTLDSLVVSEDSRVSLRGGNIGYVVSQSYQAVHIYGSDFQWEPSYNPLRGVLTGLWENGTEFKINLRDCPPTNGYVVLHEVPEPTSLALFAIGLGLFRKKIR